MLQFDGKKLKELRRGRGLTMSRLGEIVSRSPNHIWNYENSFADPPANVLLTFLEFFQVTAMSLSKAPPQKRLKSNKRASG